MKVMLDFNHLFNKPIAHILNKGCYIELTSRNFDNDILIIESSQTCLHNISRIVQIDNNFLGCYTKVRLFPESINNLHNGPSYIKTIILELPTKWYDIHL